MSSKFLKRQHYLKAVLKLTSEMDSIKSRINFTPHILILAIHMFTTLFRLGPLAILQLIFAGSATVIWLMGKLPDCYYFTLAYLALITFVIEMIFSLRFIKRNAKLRRKYISRRIREGDGKFYCRWAWDNLNVILVVMLLYYSLVADGIRLASAQNIHQTDPGSSNEQGCDFTVFSLCLFTQMASGTTHSPDDSMIMWLLYAATAFLSSIICVVFSKQYYQYCSSLSQNRKLFNQLGEISETLLDCSIYSINSSLIINESMTEEIGQCSICLHSLVAKNCRTEQSKVVKLSCSHLFHKECIDKWLKVKDHCPFRCSIDQH